MSEAGVRWVRVSRGFYLLGLGTFLLLSTQDLLPPAFWSDAASYWPVLLVAIGIRLVFERGPAPWLVLLGPVLVLGTLLYVALSAPGSAVAESEWAPVRIERPADAARLTFEGRLELASLDVESRRLPRDLVLEGRTSEAGRRSVRVEAAGGERVRVTNSMWEKRFVVLPGRRRARCELGVASGLPIGFDLDLAFTATRLEVAATPVSRLAIDGAFNDLSFRLGAAASDVPIDLDGAFNKVEIEVPAGTPVRVTGENLLNHVDREGAQEGAAPGGAKGAAHAYRLNLDGAFNRIVIRTK